MRVRPDGKVEPGMAKSYQISEDGKTYHFYLRKAYWSNGDRVTAKNYADAWKKILSPDFPARFAYTFYVIKGAEEAKAGKIPLDEAGIEAIDDKTLKVTLSHPAVYFLELTCNPPYFPYHEKNEEFFSQKNTNNLISNGPFKLTEYAPNNFTKMGKNPKYWDSDHVHLNNVRIDIVPDYNSCLALFEQNDVDFITTPVVEFPTDSLPSLKQKGLLKSATAPAMRWCIFNNIEAPLNNNKIRKALSLAINRNEVIENLFYGSEKPAMNVVADCMRLHDHPKYPYFDPEQAKKFLKEGLQEIGMDSFPKLTLLAAQNKNYELAQILQQEWKKNLNIDVNLELCEWGVVLSKVFNREYQIGIMSWESWINDPIYNLEAFKLQSTRINWSGWENAQYIQCLNQSDQELDLDKRRSLLQKAEDILMEDMPIAPLFHINHLFLANPKLKGYFYTSLGHLIMRNAYFESDY